ncbi:hypothetical protein FRC12_002110 [Ceratobasidium sp. 428]|nr:hypothetical protein FRC12_002110 [Ceratobasidium sp. 428]
MSACGPARSGYQWVFCHETCHISPASRHHHPRRRRPVDTRRKRHRTIHASVLIPADSSPIARLSVFVGMAGIMLRSLASSLSTERAPLPFIGDQLSAGIGCPAWSHSGTDDRAPSSIGGGKTKHVSESHRASPYPPLVRSSSGYGSGAGSKRLAATVSRSSGQPLRRTASLQGGHSLIDFQAAADDAKQSPRPASCRSASPLPKQPRHRTRTGSVARTPLRPSSTLVNTLPLDVLVCPPPAPPPRCDLRLGLEFAAPTPRRAVIIPEPPVAPNAVRRRSSLAPAQAAPTAVVMRNGSSMALPSPPVAVLLKKKRESLAQRTLRRTFEKTPRGAQVKVLGAHAAVRMMSVMNEEIEAEDEAAVAASVIVVGEDENEPEDVCMTDSWVELNNEPAAPSSPILVESSQNIPRAGVDEMEWSMIDEDECRAAA